MAKQKIDVNKIKEREVTEDEINKNKKETNKKTWLFYRIPIILDIILVVIYVPTAKNILLIPIAILFIFVLYGIDCHQRICKHCKKWNSTVTLLSERVLRKTKTKKQNLFGKDKVKEKKNIVDKAQLKCLNCGYKYDKETIK